MEKITLVHTNDLHSHLEHWPKIRRYLNQRKQEADSSQETVISLDLGDFVDRWHPLTEATNGQANIELMNQGHYDAVTIGNNEGVGNSKEELQHLYDQAEFPILLANLFDKNDLKPPKWRQDCFYGTLSFDLFTKRLGHTRTLGIAAFIDQSFAAPSRYFSLDESFGNQCRSSDRG